VDPDATSEEDNEQDVTDSEAASSSPEEMLSTVRTKLRRALKHHVVMCRAVLELENELKVQGDKFASSLALTEAKLKAMQRVTGVNATEFHNSGPGSKAGKAGQRFGSRGDEMFDFLTTGDASYDPTSVAFQAIEKLRTRSAVRGRIVAIYRECMFLLRDDDDTDADATSRGRLRDKIQRTESSQSNASGPKFLSWLDEEMSALRLEYENEIRTLEGIISRMREQLETRALGLELSREAQAEGKEKVKDSDEKRKAKPRAKSGSGSRGRSKSPASYTRPKETVSVSEDYFGNASARSAGFRAAVEDMLRTRPRSGSSSASVDSRSVASADRYRRERNMVNSLGGLAAAYQSNPSTASRYTPGSGSGTRQRMRSASATRTPQGPFGYGRTRSDSVSVSSEARLRERIKNDVYRYAIDEVGDTPSMPTSVPFTVRRVNPYSVGR
jgi:hypothetical protein